MTQSILTELRGSTFLIRMNRPERRNAFDLDMRTALAEAIYEARDNDAVKAVVLAGSEGTFCAGGDLRALSGKKMTVAESRDRIRRLHPWFTQLLNLEKPVISAVDGPAFGAGFNLALACDFILGTPRTRMCAVFGRIGLVPDLGGFYLLPRIVGLQRAKELVFSARELGAEEAKSMGILYDIYDPEQLEQAAFDMAETFAHASTEAIGMSKNIMNRSFNLDYDTLAEMESYAQALAIQSSYHGEAVKRFIDKQPLSFVWKNKK